jgi:hypothetical protein
MNYWGIFFSFIFIPSVLTLLFGAAHWFEKIDGEL